MGPKRDYMNSADRYSHWSVTGAMPKPHSGMSPIDSAISFERYRLAVISRWPEDEVKRARIRNIQHTLEQLESDRKRQQAA